MKILIKILIGLAALFAISSHAEVVKFEQIQSDFEPKVLEQPYILSSPSARIYISSGTGRSIRLYFKDIEGSIVVAREKFNVDYDDTFQIDGTTHYGAIFEVESLPEGPLTLTVERGTFDAVNDFITNTYEVIVDKTPPSITGSFFWDAHSTAYWTTHTDGKFIVSLAGARQAGFPIGMAGISGYSHSTFTSEFLDGPRAGEKHANELPAQLTNDGRLIIGTGVDNSISTAYVPSNTAAQMRFTFRLFNKAGLSSERSVDLYVATQATQSKPQPYGVFTGQPEMLDGIPAFAGFAPYMPNMDISTNPIRMIYRANKEHYLGGGGDADIYGGWVNGTRDTSHVVHIDDSYLYFDVTGSTNGNQISEGTFYIRDLASWRRHFFEHQLTLSEAIMPPEATEIAYYQEGADRWFSHPSSLSTYITKDNISSDNDAITKIRVGVKSRSYDQRFSYDFNRDGTRHQGSCIIPAAQTECLLDVNLPYPGDDISTYHNRHRILGVGNGLLSDELVTNWQFDGAPSSIDTQSIIHDPLMKTVTFTVVKPYATRIWGNAQIRVANLNASPVSSPAQRLSMALINTQSEQKDGSQYNTYTYSYSSLADGEYAFHAYVEDGFSNGLYRHKQEREILSVTSLDLAPPVINTNINSSPITSLTNIRINLTDASNAFIRSLTITGGPENINLALPYQLISLKQFRGEFIFLNPTEDLPYQLTINAVDAAGNESTASIPFFYQPQTTRLPDARLPAIASPLRNPEGKPHNVIVTPQIRNSEGVTARGVHTVYFTLTPSAEVDLVVNGDTVTPGQTISFDTNLSLSNHRLRLEVYPASGGDVTENDFQIHIPNIKVTLCPVTFVETGSKCIFLNFKETTKVCPSSFTLNGNQCESQITYEPITGCAEGYTLDGLSCKGSYSIAPVSTCPTGYGLMDETTCRRHDTVKASPCPAGQTLEDGMCKSSEGQLTNTALYCSGQDVSSGPHCENDICTMYNPSWNACEVITPSVANRVCSSGELTSGRCVVPHQYTLNVSCPFGYNREGLNCTRLEIVEPIKSCDDGWELSSTGCIQQEFAQFESCPSTHALIDGRCHHLQDVTITCPDTFNWDGAQCSRVVVDSATPVCPDSYEWTGTTCRRMETEDATPVCDATYLWDGEQCSRTVTQAAEPICSAGYSWNSALATCEKPEFVERLAICEAGQTADGEICLEDATQPAVITCSSGYTWNGTSCTQTQINPATPVCQSGYTWSLVNSRCERTETNPATAVCPSGYSWSTTNTRCEQPQTQSATPVCQTGYSWSTTNNQCETTANQSATPVCPSGYSWSTTNTRCEQPQTQPAIPICPSGYSWSSSNSRCERGLTQSATPVCPSGYAWSSSNSRCEQPQTQAATPVCNSGYSWNGSNCSRSETQSATPVCASGYSWNGSVCTRTDTNAATRNCPSGYSWNGSTCARNESQSATPVCASGYSWNGSVCNRTETNAATRNCSSGYSWNGSSCSRSETQSATRNCASGYSWNGSTCTQTQSSSATLTRTCPSGGVSSGSTCTLTSAASLRCPSTYNESTWRGTCTYQASNVHDAATRSCHFSLFSCRYNDGGATYLADTSKVVSGIAYYSCSSGWTLSGSTCTRTYAATSVYSCSSGWTLSGTTCSRTVTQSPTYSCSAGWTLSGTTCSRLLTQTPTYSCSAGWTLSGITCSRTLTQGPSSYTCPSGWVVSGSSCNRTLTSAPTYSCSSGWTLSGSSCSRTLTQAPSSYTCPSGWNVSGSSCNRTLTQAPGSYSCPAGWSLSGSNCNRVATSSPASYSCPSGWTVSGSNCTQLQTSGPSSYSCPSGWSLSGSTCNRTVTTGISSYTCPSGWMLSGSSCSQVQSAPPAYYSCPSGWTLSGTNCTRILSTGPSSYSCATGWTLSGSTCSQLLTSSPESYSCSAGWVLSAQDCSRIFTQEPLLVTCEEGWNVVGTMCSTTHTITPTNYECLSGWALEGEFCTRTVYELPASYTCPAEWNLSSTICNQEQSIDPSSYSCLAGWDLSGQSCNRFVYTDIEVYICDDGWDLDGNECSTDETALESRLCNPSYSLMNPDLCSKDEPDNFVGNCSSGWTILATQCMFVHQQQFNLSCNTGYTLNAAQCHRTLQQSVSVACQNGDQLVDGVCRNSVSTPVITTCSSPYVKQDTQCRHRIEIDNFDQL